MAHGPSCHPPSRWCLVECVRLHGRTPRGISPAGGSCQGFLRHACRRSMYVQRRERWHSSVGKLAQSNSRRTNSSRMPSPPKRQVLRSSPSAIICIPGANEVRQALSGADSARGRANTHHDAEYGRHLSPPAVSHTSRRRMLLPWGTVVGINGLPS